jgi:hypothetical protein
LAAFVSAIALLMSVAASCVRNVSYGREAAFPQPRCYGVRNDLERTQFFVRGQVLRWIREKRSTSPRKSTLTDARYPIQASIRASAVLAVSKETGRR